MGIKTKILLPMAALAILVAAAILISNIALFSGFVDESTLERINSSSKVAVNMLEELKADAAAASFNLAGSSGVGQAIVNQDREELLALAGQMQTTTGVEFCTVTDARGTVILRTHAPDRYGDSIAAQANIKAALAGTSLTCVEPGSVVLLSVRAGAPVFDEQGVLVGAVSVGYHLDTEHFVDAVKEVTNCEITVLLGDERISTTILREDGARAAGTKTDPEISEIVLAGNAHTGQINILGRTALAHYTPIAGADDQIIGMLFVGLYIDEREKTIQSFVRSGLIFAFLMLALVTLVILLIVDRIVTPIQAMTRAAGALASGDLDIEIRVETRDEMHTLADAFNRMIDNTRQQVRTVEQIARGELALSPQERSDKDLMNRALAGLNETIRAQAAAIREEHERVKLMLDATPLASRLWNKDFELIECNEAAVKLFQFKDKREYIERYFELSPEYQPDGQKTRDKVMEVVSRAFAEGEYTCEWMYHMFDGTPVPSEITLVRMPYGDDYVVASYARDLREHKKMMSAIEQRDNLLDISNRTAFTLFTTADDSDVGPVLVESMRLLGQGVGADHIHLLRNELADGLPQFVCNYAWAAESGHARAAVPGAGFACGDDPDWAYFLLPDACANGPAKDLPQSCREFFASFGAESVLLIPVFLQDHFWGLVSFSDCRQERIFGEDEVSILRSASLMMAAAVNRNIQAATIREAHQRTRLLINSTPLSFNLWDRHLHNFETNDTALELFGLASQKEYLDRFFELSPKIQPDGRPSREKAADLIDRAFQEGHCRFEWQHQKLDGTPIPSEVTLVRLAYGDDYMVAGYVRDLREQKEMLAAIEQRDNLLQAVNLAADILLRSEPDDFRGTLLQCMGMLTRAINADRMYLYKNSLEDGRLYCTQLYEWAENVLSFWPAAPVAYDERSPEIGRTLARGDCVRGLVRDLGPVDRAWLEAQNVLSVLAVPIFIRNEFWGFVGFDNCRDERLFTENEESIMHSGSLLIANALLRNEYLLDIRDTSAKLETALADAREASTAKSNFLAHMSHEIRTPLNAVIGLSELMLGDAGLSRETESSLEKIYNSGATILSIVNDILDISKIESGKFEICAVQYDTPSLINDTVTQNVIRIGEKSIDFRLQVDANLPGQLYGDDLRVKQIFNNLLSNAFKFTRSGTVEWRLSFEREGEDVWLVSSVQDTGIGIKPDDLRKLFSDYNQVDVQTNRQVTGTGLGLAIAKRLVEMMDGGITVASEYGQGTTFTVRLRQRLVSELPIGPEVAASLMGLQYTLSRRAKHTKLARINLSYAHVLVVDDVATNLDVARGMLKPYELQVDCATCGRQAIEMIRAGSPRYSAIFMDHMMPEMDGLEATRIIREEIGTDYARNIPVIALTANAIVGNEEMFLNLGFQAFISKPIDMLKLDSVLRQWVRNKDLEKDPPLPEVGEPAAGQEGARNSPLSLAGLWVNGVDKGKLLERFGGSAEVIVDVLRSYAVNTRALLGKLKEDLDAENLEDYAIVIHGIKGASYGICAQKAGKAAELLEVAARAGNLATVGVRHLAFEIIAEVLLDDLDRALAELDTASKPLAAEPSPELLLELREACAAFDMDRVDQAMARLESVQYARGGKTVAWLRTQVNNMTFEEICNGQWPLE